MRQLDLAEAAGSDQGRLIVTALDDPTDGVNYCYSLTREGDLPSDTNGLVIAFATGDAQGGLLDGVTPDVLITTCIMHIKAVYGDTPAARSVVLRLQGALRALSDHQSHRCQKKM